MGSLEQLYQQGKRPDADGVADELLKSTATGCVSPRAGCCWPKATK
jgi:hypothetical protein